VEEIEDATANGAVQCARGPTRASTSPRIGQTSAFSADRIRRWATRTYVV